MKTLVALVIAVACLPAAALAQDPARNVLTIQPLSAVFGFYSGEYERVVAKTFTWGVGANYWQLGDPGDRVRYTSSEFKLRYYPSGEAPRGFSLGGAIGVTSIKGTTSDGDEASVAGPSLAVLLEYQWLLGEKQDFAVALGAGAKAINVVNADFSNGDYTAKYPTLRISVGWRF
jgi:hypothetical protein